MDISDPEVQTFFDKLGCTREETRLYLTLTQRGTLTTLELSRCTTISRTQVYRILTNLKAKGLVEEVVDEHRTLSRACDPAQLESLISQHIRVATSLKQQLPNVIRTITATAKSAEPETMVRFYRGKQGIRQMIWHTLAAKHEIVGYTYRRLEHFVGFSFMEDWRNAFVRKGLLLRDIYSDEYLKSKREEGSTVSYPKKNFISRYVSPEILSVTMQMDIYNDVVSQYTWYEGDVFGVELYNPKNTRFHLNIFEIIWKIATPEEHVRGKK